MRGPGIARLLRRGGEGLFELLRFFALPSNKARGRSELFDERAHFGFRRNRERFEGSHDRRTEALGETRRDLLERQNDFFVTGVTAHRAVRRIAKSESGVKALDENVRVVDAIDDTVVGEGAENGGPVKKAVHPA